jgi:hypothetical protein
MSFNGSGTFLINTAGQPVVAGTVISSTAFNALTADLATGLSTVITKDGQTTVTANIPMSTYKFTGLGVGSAATDSANLSQVQSTVTKLLTSVSGTDTITAVGAPVVAAYAAGQMFYFVATGDNTGAVTLNIDSLGAKAVTRDGSVALAAGDIKSGEVVVVVYDGTRFQVVSQLNSAGDARFANVSIASSLYVGGVSTFVGNAGFSANVSIASALSVGGVAAITGATTIGGNLTLNGGTANGVLFLNGSKVATSGSALTFDGTNFTVGVSATTGDYKTFIQKAGGELLGLNASSGTLARIAFGNTTAAFGSTQIIANAADLAFITNSAEQMRLTSTGLGIGTSSPTDKLQVGAFSGNNVITVGAGTAGVSSVYFGDGTGADRYRGYIDYVHTSDRFEFGTSATTKATLDSSGNLGIGTSSPVEKLDVVGNCKISSGSSFYWGDATSQIVADNGGAMRFLTGTAAERARITSAGYSKFSNDGTYVGSTGGYHELRVSGAAADWTTIVSNAVTTGANAYGVSIRFTGSTPNNTGNEFIQCLDATATRFAFRSNGGLANYSANDVNLSDERTKKDIVPLGSMWDKFKAIEIVAFKYKDQTHEDNNIGVIAQQVESVAPEFVDVDGFGDTPEDGVPLKTVYTTDMYHAAIKALQEAMARIEQLEADVAALKGN